MKILLATGIFYPDVGGPAIHVRKIAEKLVSSGFDVTVIAYGDDTTNQKFSFKVKRISRRYHIILQWLFYSILTFKESFSSKLVYAFDPTSAGIPSAFSAKILGKPFIIRIGGDPIWERQVETGKRFMSITDYYSQGLYKKDKPFLYKLIRTTLSFSKAVVVVYSKFFKDFYTTYFGVPEDKIKIVKNPVFKRETGSNILADDPIILFAGRFVAYKNLPLVMNVFAKIRSKYNKGRLMLIGSGPDREGILKVRNSLPEASEHIIIKDSVPQNVLFDYIRESAVCIGPALSEFNPNFILEAISLGRPVLLSKGNGLSVDLAPEFIFDPFDSKQLEEKLEYFFDVENYKIAVDNINNLSLNQTWEDVTDFHLSLVKKFIK